MWLALFGTLFGSLLSGVWIGTTLGLTAVVIMHFWGPGLSLLGREAWSGINMYALTSLPGYIFMGEVIVRSGISGRIYQNVSPLTARLPGKLLHSNIVLCAIFAAVLGTSTGTAAVVGMISIPELRARKYQERLLLGSVCTAGTLGLMIPPSGAFILYGAMTNTSIAALFAAGTIPGIMLALGFVSYIGIKGMITPAIAPVEEKTLPFKATLLSLLKLWPIVVLMVICVGPIYVGWCTAPEGAGIGALGAIIIGSIFGKLDRQTMKAALVECTETSAMIFFLVVGAMLLATSVSTIGLPRAVALQVVNLPLSPVVILMLIYTMYLVMGCFLDGISMVLMTIPFMAPIISSLGFDLVWFGVILTLVIEIGLVTPPVGLNLFVLQGIGGPKTSLSDIFMGSIPFLVIALAVTGVIVAFPEIVSFLPRFLGL